MIRRFLSGALALVAACALACSEPPTKERHQADEALAAARTADAITYAPDALQSAESALQKYDEAVAQRDYRLALSFAVDARDRAYAAAKLATEQKTAARTRAEQLLAELDTLSKTAAARLAGTAGPRLSAPAADRLRAASRMVPDALQEAGELVAVQDFRGAALRLTPVVDALRRELAANEPAGGRRGRTS